MIRKIKFICKKLLSVKNFTISLAVSSLLLSIQILYLIPHIHKIETVKLELLLNILTVIVTGIVTIVKTVHSDIDDTNDISDAD